MILQRSRNSRMVLWKRKLTDQGRRPVWQRQSRARAERDSKSCSDWLSRTKNWPLPCRDSSQREQREITGLVWEQISVLVWEQDIIEILLYIYLEVNFKRPRPRISLWSLPLLSLPGRGLFPVCVDSAGLLHRILVLWILNLSWKLHGLLGPYLPLLTPSLGWI